MNYAKVPKTIRRQTHDKASHNQVNKDKIKSSGEAAFEMWTKKQHPDKNKCCKHLLLFNVLLCQSQRRNMGIQIITS